MVKYGIPISDFLTPVLPLLLILHSILKRSTGCHFTLQLTPLGSINNAEPLQARARHIPALPERKVGLQTVHLRPHRLRADGEHGLHSSDIALERDRGICALGDTGIETADQVIAALLGAEERLGRHVEEAASPPHQQKHITANIKNHERSSTYNSFEYGDCPPVGVIRYARSGFEISGLSFLQAA